MIFIFYLPFDRPDNIICVCMCSIRLCISFFHACPQEEETAWWTSANHEGGAMEEWGEEWGQGYKDNWYAKEHPKP